MKKPDSAIYFLILGFALVTLAIASPKFIIRDNTSIYYSPHEAILPSKTKIKDKKKNALLAEAQKEKKNSPNISAGFNSYIRGHAGVQL